MSISGYILLQSKNGNVSSSKKYYSLSDRKKIIADWIKKYRLEDKSYVLTIQPDVKDIK